MKPTVNVVNMQTANMVCTSMKNVDGNAGLKYGGGSSDPAQSRGGWDDED